MISIKRAQMLDAIEKAVGIAYDARGRLTRPKRILALEKKVSELAKRLDGLDKPGSK